VHQFPVSPLPWTARDSALSYNKTTWTAAGENLPSAHSLNLSTHDRMAKAQWLCALENEIIANGKLSTSTKHTEDAGARGHPSAPNKLGCRLSPAQGSP